MLPRTAFHILAILSLGASIEAEEKNSQETLELDLGYISAYDKGAEDVVWLSTELLGYMQAFPHVRIEATTLDQPLRYKQAVEDIPVLPRHILGVDSWSGYEISYLVERELIVPLDTLDDGAQDFFRNFPQSLIEPIIYQDRIWGVPWATDGLVIAYQPAMLQEAGYNTPPGDWEEFLSACELLTKDIESDGSAE